MDQNQEQIKEIVENDVSMMSVNDCSTPLKAIAEHCKNCSGDSLADVATCGFTDCPLYSRRFGKKPIGPVAKGDTALNAIKLFCLEFEGGSAANVKVWLIPTSSLAKYRFGKNPKRARIGSVSNLILRSNDKEPIHSTSKSKTPLRKPTGIAI